MGLQLHPGATWEHAGFVILLWLPALTWIFVIVLKP